MLRSKDIAKLEELKMKFQDDWFSSIPDYLNIFHSKDLSLISTVKKSGISVYTILKILVALPFTGYSSIHSLSSACTSKTSGEKDVYYRFLSNQKINWRTLLFVFVKRYLQFEPQFENQGNSPSCLIFDDTDLPKRGKKIEGVSKIHSHVNHCFIFGFKLLVAGYWNGTLFIPVDFSFHRESKKKNYGLKAKELRKQRSTQRKKGSQALKRFKELDMKKPDSLVQMVKRCKQRKIIFEYILIDSWFTTVSLIKNIKECDEKVDIIGMYKYNSKLILEDYSEHSIKALRKKGKLKRSRKTGFYYCSYIGTIDEQEVKVFLSRRGKRGSWHTIISTNTKLIFNEMVEIYNIRWSIEVFFKEAKQLLSLGKAQSTNFDVHIAYTTLTMIRYLLLSMKFRTETYETIGGVFREMKQNYLDIKLNERIMGVILQLFEILDTLGIVFDVDIVVSNLINSTEMNIAINSETQTE